MKETSESSAQQELEAPLMKRMVLTLSAILLLGTLLLALVRSDGSTPTEHDKPHFRAVARDNTIAPEAHDTFSIAAWSKSTNNLFKPVLLTNYKPLLRMQHGTTVRPLQIKTIRTAAGMTSIIGARLARNSIQVDWSRQAVSQGEAVSGKGGDAPVPQAIPAEMFLTSGEDELGYKNGEKSFKTNWQPPSPDCLVFPLALDADYRYAFGLVRRTVDGKNIVDHVVAVDVEQKKVADLIAIPAVEMGANVVFDTTTEYLLILDSEWKWMMMLDLKASN